MDSLQNSARRPRVLVHLPNWLGDVIMTTPLLDFLTRAMAAVPEPERPELHLAVRRPWAVLFRDDPRLTQLLILDRDGRHSGLSGIWRQATDMKRGQYDAVLVGPPSLRAGLTARLAGIPHRVGHSGDGRDGLLAPVVARGPRGSRHFSFEMLELGLALLESLGLSAPPLTDTELPLSSLPGCAGLAAADETRSPEPAWWVVAPGTTYGEAKTWPQARMAEFIELAARQIGVRVVLLGDGQATPFVAAIRRSSQLSWSQELTAPGQVVDLTGRTDLEQAVRVLKSATAFVGNDSGLMHLAGALGLPTVGIFGSSNPAWTQPLGPRTAAVVAQGFACQPCYRRTCNQPEFCLQTVEAKTVLARLLAVQGATAPQKRGD